MYLIASLSRDFFIHHETERKEIIRLCHQETLNMFVKNHTKTKVSGLLVLKQFWVLLTWVDARSAHPPQTSCVFAAS